MIHIEVLREKSIALVIATRLESYGEEVLSEGALCPSYIIESCSAIATILSREVEGDDMGLQRLGNIIVPHGRRGIGDGVGLRLGRGGLRLYWRLRLFGEVLGGDGEAIGKRSERLTRLLQIELHLIRTHLAGEGLLQPVMYPDEVGGLRLVALV